MTQSASSALHSPLLQAIPEALLHVSGTGIILDFKAAPNVPPYLPPDAMGHDLHEYLSAEFMMTFHERRTRLQVGAEYSDTWEYTIPGRHWQHFQEARLMRLADDEYVVVIRDITDRKWAEQASRHSEDYYRQLIQNLKIGVLIQEPTGEILLSNRAAEQLLGVDESALFGALLTQLDLPYAPNQRASMAPVLADLSEALTQAQPLQNAVLALQPPQSGVLSWLLIDVVPQLSDEGVVEYVVTTLIDITDFKNAEAALNASEERYQALIDSIHEVIFLIDLQGDWVFLNPAWEDISGYPAAECIGSPWTQHLHPEDQPAAQALVERLASQLQERDSQSFRLQQRDGEYRHIEVRAQLMRAEDEVPVGITGMLIDVTERRRSEEQKIRLEAQSRSIAAQRQLLTSLSHDMRTPLSIISTSSYLLGRRLPENEQLQLQISKIQDQVKRLTATMDRITTLSKLVLGDVVFMFSRTQLNPVVEQRVARHQAAAQQQQKGLRLELQPDLPPLRLDTSWFADLFEQLLKNAFQHTAPGAIITVRTWQQGNMALLTVSDTGEGIPEEDLPHIFEPFYRVDKVRKIGDDRSGLGLSIARRIAEAHHGSIALTSEFGKGTQVVVSLPLADAQRG